MLLNKKISWCGVHRGTVVAIERATTEKGLGEIVNFTILWDDGFSRTYNDYPLKAGYIKVL